MSIEPAVLAEPVRFEVVLTDQETGHQLDTFTWAQDIDEAVRRMEDHLAAFPGIWDSWTAVIWDPCQVNA
ncbi:hypothetical protein [Streptomyces sp. NBC_01304]|uniref:hypothetical protein n=1 Tax=Streptomyces sp. NBC_01304 TaxID=2903818 RepID=UPI002E15BEDF|nr:hypothetical protein OG430_44540 [Streptomyces sp. NBC_01304]